MTAQRCVRFDELAVELGRDPRQIRHSLVCFPPLTPWESTEYFTDMVGRFCAVGIDEFVLYWPGTWRDEPRGETHDARGDKRDHACVTRRYLNPRKRPNRRSRAHVAGTGSAQRVGMTPPRPLQRVIVAVAVALVADGTSQVVAVER